jgi:hypothetical protein
MLFAGNSRNYATEKETNEKWTAHFSARLLFTFWVGRFSQNLIGLLPQKVIFQRVSRSILIVRAKIWFVYGITQMPRAARPSHFKRLNFSPLFPRTIWHDGWAVSTDRADSSCVIVLHISQSLSWQNEKTIPQRLHDNFGRSWTMQTTSKLWGSMRNRHELRR